MLALRIEPARALAATLFQRIGEKSADAPGVTRVAYGPGENMAFREVAEAAIALGAEQAFDAAGNQFLTLPGQDRSRRIVIGSHLDSVPHGGNYDGAAGVILGIAALQALVENNIVPAFDITVACLRAEESCWFPHSYIGSKTALGCLEKQVIDSVRRSDSGRTLAEHITECGFVPDGVRRGEHLLRKETLVAYLEPHIEQAPLLLNEQIPVGVVTGIRGSLRFRQMRCLGEYSHSGAMPRIYRRDAMVATARLISEMHDWWEQVEANGDDVTVTFGQVATDPVQHSFSKVAGAVDICLDIRSADPAMLIRAEQQLTECLQRIAARTATRFETGPRSGSSPALMDQRLIALTSEAVRQCGLPLRLMASGAGHDAATFALSGVPSVMLFIRNSHGSHNPAEHMELTDFNAALDVVFALLQREAGAWCAE